MTLIDFGDFKLRFDPKDVRISIDGEMIDVGARRDEVFPEFNNEIPAGPGLWKVTQTKKKVKT
jgi:hypothetical protein